MFCVSNKTLLLFSACFSACWQFNPFKVVAFFSNCCIQLIQAHFFYLYELIKKWSELIRGRNIRANEKRTF